MISKHLLHGAGARAGRCMKALSAGGAQLYQRKPGWRQQGAVPQGAAQLAYAPCPPPGPPARPPHPQLPAKKGDASASAATSQPVPMSGQMYPMPQLLRGANAGGSAGGGACSSGRRRASTGAGAAGPQGGTFSNHAHAPSQFLLRSPMVDGPAVHAVVTAGAGQGGQRG